MKKNIINEEVMFNFYWNGLVSMEKMEKDIAELRRLGVTHLEFYVRFDDIEIDAIRQRPETKEELRSRKLGEELKAKEQLERDRLHYERLKKLFELRK